MALLPLQPRLARLMLEGELLGAGGRAALCAALLRKRDPFRRPQAHLQAEHQSDSDVLDRVSALEEFAESGARDSLAGELMPGPARQTLRAAEQLQRLTGKLGRDKNRDEATILRRSWQPSRIGSAKGVMKEGAAP